jgi:tetratricopeptide (TPR) repeat protein
MLRAALELLDLLIAEYPEGSQLASAFHQRARCLSDLGEHAAAIDSYRRSFEARRNAPGWKDLAYLDFGELVLALRREELYDEALAVLSEFGGDEVFPVHQYQAACIRSLIADQRGDEATARRFAQEALAAASATESPFRYHRMLGLVTFVDPEVMERLRALSA